MKLEPIRKNLTLKEQAYQAIRQAIFSNTLKPGTPLTEELLSNMLSISRTPIRSALQQLVYEKLACSDSTGHIYVSTITEKDVEDVTTLRAVLEPMAFDHAVLPLPDEYLSRLHDSYRKQTELFHNEPENNLRYAEIDSEFHCLLSEISDNGLLTETIATLNTVMIRINILSGTLHSHMQNALNEHADIISYLEKGQIPFARLALEEHIKHVELRMFSQDNSV